MSNLRNENWRIKQQHTLMARLHPLAWLPAIWRDFRLQPHLFHPPADTKLFVRHSKSTKKSKYPLWEKINRWLGGFGYTKQTGYFFKWRPCPNSTPHNKTHEKYHFSKPRFFSFATTQHRSKIEKLAADWVHERLCGIGTSSQKSLCLSIGQKGVSCLAVSLMAGIWEDN